MSRNAEKTKNSSWILAKKELKLLFKSKRRIFILGITPLMILLIGVIAVVSAGSFANNQTQPVNVWVINDSPSNYTSSLLTLYDSVEGTHLMNASQSYDQLINSSNFQIIVYFPSNFTTEVQNKTAAVVEITYNTNSSRYYNTAIQFRQLTAYFEQQLVQADNPGVVFNRVNTNLTRYEKPNSGISEELANTILIIPVYIVFFIVIPPISLIMISVTIEREEKTLETLFLQPVSRNSIIMGKILYGMLLILGILVMDIIAGVADYLLINRFIIQQSNGGQSLDINALMDTFFDLIGVDLVVYFLLSVAIIATMVVSLSVLLSLLAKDEREANLISSILPLLIFSIIFVVQFVDINAFSNVVQTILTILPVIGILVAFYLSLISGGLGTIAIISGVAQVVWTILIIFFAARLSESESILELTMEKVWREFIGSIFRR